VAFETADPADVALSSKEEDEVEYRRRLAAVRQLMASEDHDVLVVAGSDAWQLPGGHVRYLSNFTAGSAGPPASYLAVVLPGEGEPILVVPPGPLGCFVEWATRTSWIREIRSPPEPPWSREAEMLPAVVAAVMEVGGEAGRVGVCGAFPGIGDLPADLPKAEVRDAAILDSRGIPRDIIERVRDVKSEWEVRRLKAAQRLVEINITAFMGAVRPGRKQSAAMAEGDWAAIKRGAEDTLTVMSAGTEPWVWWHSKGNLAFHTGDLVALEANARVDGYIAQICRGGTIGPSSKVQRHVIETATEALNAMVAAVAPGVTGGELWTAAEEIVHGANLDMWGRFGHGIGLAMSEALDVMPQDDRVILEGQCIELHAGVKDRNEMQSVLIGEQYMIENGKPLPLSDSVLPFDLAPRPVS
jgi:Xaa-Pro aminopeptidase